jgi:predicted nucleic acid-binding Zn ribbon protein
MNCPRCGAAFSEGKFFCENCGERRPTYFSPAHSVSSPEYQVKTEEKPAPEVSAPVFSPAAPPPSETKSDSNRTRNIVIISYAAVILVALILLLSIQIGKDNLKKELMRDWSRVEIEGSSYYTLELDFSEDEIEYNFDGYYFNSNIATYEYEIVSANQFRVEGSDEIYTVEFNDDRTMMTIKPALTSSGYSEYWFHH